MRFLFIFLLLCAPVLAQNDGLWQSIDQEVKAAIAEGQMAGATVLVGKGEKILYHQVYGAKDAVKGTPLTESDLFDAASLTKPLATALAVLILHDEGKVRLEAPVSEYLDVSWKNPPTIAQLLTHHGGLPPGVPLEKLDDFLRAGDTPHPAGSKFVYSDTGFILLGRVVEKQSGLTLDEFFNTKIAAPAGLKSSGFLPLPSLCVPTFGVSPGTVHDPRARQMGGVAGHAGLFTNAQEVHQLMVSLPRLLSSHSLDLMFQEQQGGRTLGLDQDTRFSAPRGERFSPHTSAGHTGFTGTSVWWDQPTGYHVVLMASRLHPDNKGSVVPLRRRLGTLVANEFLGEQVRLGLEHLVSDQFEPLKGKRVAMVVNQTTRDRFGRHLTELLPPNPDFELVRLFTPEHGLLGVRDEKIEHGFHKGLDVPIKSLYGETRKPKREWLADVDVLLFDLQDVGVRYYTYISTLKACLEVAKETGTNVVVLDRPNPLGGEIADGRIATRFTFIGSDALPLVHGMTVGEVGHFLNREIGANYDVIKMTGWSRDMEWPQTGLPLFSPSPNLAEWESIALYPVIGQIEWCELSVGRGTRSPFRVFGAPYIKDPGALSHYLNQHFQGALNFRPRFFVPQSSVFAGELCGGVEVTRLRKLERPAFLGNRLAELLWERYPQDFRIEKMDKHLGTNDVVELLQTDYDPSDWHKVRRSYLLY